jgi:hypothetical protein
MLMQRSAAALGAAVSLLFPVLLLPAAAGAQQVKPLCTEDTRACMIATATTYLDALTHHDASKVPFAPDIRRTEQNRISATDETHIREHTITQPDMAGHADDRFFVDEKTHNVVVFTLLKVPGGANPRRPPAATIPGPTTVHLAERFKVEGGLIREIEAIFYQEPGTMEGPAPWPAKAPVAASGQATVKPSCTDASRDCMIAAAKSYFDGIVSKNSSKVPFAANVRRTVQLNVWEGETALRHYLDHEEPPMAGHQSRYFVDEHQHTVLVYTTINITGNANGGAGKDGGSPAISRVADRIKVEGGYITEIEGLVFGEPGSDGRPLWPN